MIFAFLALALGVATPFLAMSDLPVWVSAVTLVLALACWPPYLSAMRKRAVAQR